MTNKETPPGQPVTVGDVAPDFTLPSQDGGPLQLSRLVETKCVVLFFYPRNNTSVCTAEACAFRDSYEVFKDAGAEVVGVSSDPVSSHQQFARDHRLPFRLVSDADGALRARYGVPRALMILPGRTTYVIDRQRVVRDVFTAHLQSAGHVERALAIVKQIGGAARS